MQELKTLMNDLTLKSLILIVHVLIIFIIIIFIQFNINLNLLSAKVDNLEKQVANYSQKISEFNINLN